MNFERTFYLRDEDDEFSDGGAYGDALEEDFERLIDQSMTAAGPTLIGVLSAKTGSMPLAISLLSLIYLIGLPLIRLAPETAGKPLAR